MSLQPLAAGDLGTDVDSSFGVPLRWGLATGRKNLGNAICRRLSTKRGSLHYDLSYGYDVRGKLNVDFDSSTLSQEQSAITSEVEKEERVQSCDTTFDFNFGTSETLINLLIDEGDGPFELILLVTDVSVSIWDKNQPTAQAAATAIESAATTVIVGAPGAPGAPGTGIPGASGVGGTIEIPFVGLYRSSIGTEELIDEQTRDFNNLAGGALTVDVSGSGMSAAGSATLRVYVGGTLGVLDAGSPVATIPITAAALAEFAPVSVPLANPTGFRFVKLSLQSSGAGVQAQILNINVQVSAP